DTVPRTLTTENLEKAKSTSVQQWEQGGPMSQLPVVEGVIKRATQSDRPTLHFAHVLLPHRPWMLTPDMRYSRALPTDKRSNEILDRVRDEYQAHLLQYAAVDTVIGDMVTGLKKSENWDRTMIIVTADHGITFVPGESKRKTVNANNVGTLEDLYRIPLFIKFPGQQAAAQDDCTASSVDILATVVAATGIDAGWKTDGADLLRKCPQRESRPVIWPDGSADMSTGFSEAIARAKYYDSWVDAKGDVADITRGGINGDLVGTRMIANSSSETKVRWSIDRPDDLQRIGTDRLSFAPAQIQGRLTASRNFAEDEEALLVIDGVVVGIISELAGLQSGTSTSFRTTLLSSALLSGKHTVEMWVASGSGAQRTTVKASGG
ncbi:MAG: sulfatase-like hydrolase/transferase, partial [Ilumatobacteraceae bacterium]